MIAETRSYIFRWRSRFRRRRVCWSSLITLKWRIIDVRVVFSLTVTLPFNLNSTEAKLKQRKLNKCHFHVEKKKANSRNCSDMWNDLFCSLPLGISLFAYVCFLSLLKKITSKITVFALQIFVAFLLEVSRTHFFIVKQTNNER